MNKQFAYSQIVETPEAKKRLSHRKSKQVINPYISFEMRYRRLFETAKDGILILDPITAKIVDANPFIVHLMGSTQADVIGKELWEIGLFRNRDESKQAFNDLKINRYIRFDDMPLLRTNGENVEVEFVSNVYQVNNIDVIQCNIRDITERKQKDRALRENEQLLSKTQQIAKIGSYNYSFYNNEIKWSDEMYNIFGLQKTNFTLTAESFMDCIHPFDKSSILIWIRQTTLGNQQSELDFRIVKPDGNIRNIYGTGILQIDKDGKPIQIIGSMQDITERKSAEKALKDKEMHLQAQNAEILKLNKEYLTMNEHLSSSLIRIQQMNEDLIISKNKAEESDKLKSAFLANISHEIRTPMNAIMGFSELLTDPDLTESKSIRYVQIIDASCNQLLTVISDIIDISKIEADQVIIEKEPVNISTLLEDIHATYKNQIYSPLVNLVYDFKPELGIVETETDKNRVKQVLCNLLNNALKFTHEGEVRFGINIKDDFIEFYVNDTGIGIAAVDQDIVFERFRQVEKTKVHVYGGNGLGLSISKAMVEKLGGEIMFSSEPGKGSNFRFTIPYLTNINAPEPLKHLKIGNIAENWYGKTILIAEDDISSHAYIEEILSLSKAKTFHAWNGEKAIEMVKEHPEISLVLMDIKMPIIDGDKATKIIKKTNPKLPIIAITAHALNHDKAQALQSGFDNYISKPIHKKDLLELIAFYLN
jgi:PAS domain S-box-containing protein